MKKKIVLFGAGKIAEVIHYYAQEECDFDVVAFCVDQSHLTSDTFLGKPVISFETIQETFSPNEVDFFVALGYHDLNGLRKLKCEEVMLKGYNLVSIISPNSNLPKNVTYGHNCFIMPPAIVHPCVKLGNNVFVWSGAMVGHHSIIGDDCWLTSSCNLGGNVEMGSRTFVAMNATISHSVKIGESCFLGANVLVLKNMENNQVVISEGNKPIKLNSQQFLKFSNFSSL